MRPWGRTKESEWNHSGSACRGSWLATLKAGEITAALRAADGAIVRRRQAALLESEASLGAFRREAAEAAFAEACELTERLRVLRAVTAPRAPAPATPVYVAGSLFLGEAYAALVRDPAEEMHFVTGCEVGGYRMLERLVTFEKTERTAVRVAGEPSSSHAALISLEARGYRLTAWMHSHPGHGPSATMASGIDMGHQARLERGRYPAIGAVFSRDGYVRFFSKDLPFAVQIFGKGVTRLDERLYQLQAD
jgi:proteasome lid subunit RPN8/RPN11